MKQCRVFRMTLTAKAVLMALADMADDDGHCWPSLETLAEYTCASKRAVIDAIKYLESAQVLVSDRSNGRKTTYTLTPESFVPVVIMSARTEARRKSESGANAAPVDAPEPVQMPHRSDEETSADAAPVSDGKPVQMPHGSESGPVQMPHSTGANAAPEPVQMPHEPVRQPHSNHQEPPINHQENHQLGGDDLFATSDQQAEQATGKRTAKKAKAAGFDAGLIDLPNWVDRDIWAMWVRDRATRKKALTEDAARLSLKALDELRKQGHTPRAVIENAIASGWQGLFAPPRSATTTTRRPTSHNGLDTKNYSEGIDEHGHLA